MMPQMSAPVLAGAVLAGKYRVDRVLGEGGMGVVVAAVDLQLERRVAIKFLLPEYSQQHEAAQRFLREARAAVKIQSEHVARVIDVGTMESGAPYMVMEYLEGGDLAALLDERKALPAEEAVAYVLEACDAIAEAHSVGIVHRDLKPANLFLARQPDGSVRIKVLDFGISKALVTSTTGIDPSLTRTSSMMGSPLYMSPEQMKSAKHVDPRTDVWALGVILYELLTGEPPFYAESIPELSAKVLLDEPVPIRSVRGEIPEALESAVNRALAKDPAARFANVAEFASALAPFGPARTRANVERAGRVLKVSSRGSITNEAPPPRRDSKAPYALTAAAWTDSGAATATPPSGAAGRGRLIGGGVAVGAVAIVVGFLVFRNGGPPPATATSGMSTPHLAAEPPAPPPQPPAKVEAKPAPAPAVITVAPTLPTVAEPPPPAAPAAVPPAEKRAVNSAERVVTHAHPHEPAKAKAEASPAAPPAPVDPFSGFGSRK